MAYANGAGAFQPDRPPDPARVGVGVSAVPVLENAGDVALRGPVCLWAAGDLDPQGVIGPLAQGFGDLKGVGEEVALRVADIPPVKPDVTLVEEPVEAKPDPFVGQRSVVFETGSVEQRSVGVREGWRGAPVSGHLNGRPLVVRFRRCRRFGRGGFGPDGVGQNAVGGMLGAVVKPGPSSVLVRLDRLPRPPKFHLPDHTAHHAQNVGVGDSVSQMSNRATTIGQLRASGWESLPVKEEIRRNAVARIRAGEPLVDAVLGYEDTVLPQLENAILAGHDVIFLGERGQAKTRMIRSLTNLLDEWLPIVAGSEINDDPYSPVSRHARELVAEKGDDTPIDWIHRDTRYGEKLATPDTSIADLIGEVDPIKVAEGRYLSDELTLHYGLVPRTNRGIFAINELPDLAERIQVGLLNVLEERDVQIRGFKVRLPLDVVLFASANPEDYTNRGRLITPLKDRFGAQIRTHYPLDVETEMAIVAQEARPLEGDGLEVVTPQFMAEVVATISQLARQSSHVNQRSGVSVRLSVTNAETLVANAARRALRAGESEVVPRVSDLEALAASTSGKVELDTLDDDGGEIIDRLVKAAVLQVFRDRLDVGQLRGVLEAFDDGRVIHAGEDVSASDEVALAAEIPALHDAVVALTDGDERPGVVASAVEFVLEGLHLSKRLNKDADHRGTRATYRAR